LNSKLSKKTESFFGYIHSLKARMPKHHNPSPALDSPLGPTGGQRLYSLDALRGFDMFWILGAEDIFNALQTDSLI
jgi:hypothetical protein